MTTSCVGLPDVLQVRAASGLLEVRVERVCGECCL